jgi:hypothetical protein
MRNNQTSLTAGSVRFSKPKILALDLPSSLVDQLQAAGYNAASGTFGRPYKVKQSDAFAPMIVKPYVPNYAEQEVLVIDLTAPAAADGPESEKVTSLGELDWFAKASTGLIDPRPRVMAYLKSDSNRILKTGGLFVIFADSRERQTTVLARVNSAYFNEFQIEQEIEEDNWSILSVLSQDCLRAVSDHGTEIKVVNGLGLFSSFLNRHLDGATFSATLHPLYPLTEHGDGPIFFPLATNKFDETVAAVLAPRQNGGGFVLILPQLKNKVGAVLDLMQTVAPEICPRLFPDHEGGRWVHRDEYEHPAVLERKAAQLEIQRKANEEIARLDHDIDAERKWLGFIHGILTKSGNALVADVKRALEFIGFDKVVDVDEADDSANKQEDLQVLDASPSLLLEIKGLAGMPTDGDTLQVTKYVLRRIRQWERTDVIGLSLINHQRNQPGLERNHEAVFTEHQVQDAASNGTGLMTTRDLFHIVRGMIRWNWPKEAVRRVFYGHGRLTKTPSHYTLVGTVAHYWTEKEVISIDVCGDALRLGDRLGYLLPDGFFEEMVTSLQVLKNDVGEAQSGQRAGIKTTLARREIPVGTNVYRVGSSG